MEFISIGETIRQRVNAFIRAHWLSTDMVLRGEMVDMTKVDGIIALDDAQNMVGLLTYRISGTVCEITSLDSIHEGRGIGTALVERLIGIAREKGCERVVLITTNDNINALRFYQKRGFDLIRLDHNAMERARLLKPEIPLIGENGIPLRHELEFSYDLTGG